MSIELSDESPNANGSDLFLRRVGTSRSTPVTLANPALPVNLLSRVTSKLICENNLVFSNIIHPFTRRTLAAIPLPQQSTIFAPELTEFNKQMSDFVSLYFPVDVKGHLANNEIVLAEVAEFFAKNPQAKEQQILALDLVLDQLGMQRNLGRIDVKPNFDADACLLIKTQRGRGILNRIIRSIYWLNDKKLAESFRDVLLAVGNSMGHAGDKFVQIALSCSTSFDGLYQDLDAQKAAAQRGFVDTVLGSVPSYPMFTLRGQSAVNFRRTGLELADFFLGHTTDKNHQPLSKLILLPNLEKRLAKEPVLFSTLFPTSDKHAANTHPFVVTEHARRLFAVNPLLFLAHRKILDRVLPFFGLERNGLTVSLAKNVDLSKLDWLQPNSSLKRQQLMQMMKSLCLLDNTELAESLQQIVLDLLERNTSIDCSDIKNVFVTAADTKSRSVQNQKETHNDSIAQIYSKDDDKQVSSFEPLEQKASIASATEKNNKLSFNKKIDGSSKKQKKFAFLPKKLRETLTRKKKTPSYAKQLFGNYPLYKGLELLKPEMPMDQKLAIVPYAVFNGLLNEKTKEANKTEPRAIAMQLTPEAQLIKHFMHIAFAHSVKISANYGVNKIEQLKQNNLDKEELEKADAQCSNMLKRVRKRLATTLLPWMLTQEQLTHYVDRAANREMKPEIPRPIKRDDAIFYQFEKAVSSPLVHIVDGYTMCLFAEIDHLRPLKDINLQEYKIEVSKRGDEHTKNKMHATRVGFDRAHIAFSNALKVKNEKGKREVLTIVSLERKVEKLFEQIVAEEEAIEAGR